MDSTGLGGKYSENQVIFSFTAAFPIFRIPDHRASDQPALI
jgi:hypothetical protein